MDLWLKLATKDQSFKTFQQKLKNYALGAVFPFPGAMYMKKIHIKSEVLRDFTDIDKTG